MESNRKLHPGEEVAKEESGTSSIAWEDVTGKPNEFNPSNHYHSWEDITGKPDFLDFMNWKSGDYINGDSFLINHNVNEPIIYRTSGLDPIDISVDREHKPKLFAIRARKTTNSLVNLVDTNNSRFLVGPGKMPTIPPGGLVLVIKSPVQVSSGGTIWTEFYVIGDLLTKGKPIKNINQSSYALKKEDIGYWLIFYRDCEITYNTYDSDSEFEGEALNELVNLTFIDGTEYLSTEEGLSKELYGGGVFGIKVRNNKSGKLLGSLKPEAE